MRFFARIRLVGAGNPVFGPLPVYAQAQQRGPHRFIAHPICGQALLKAHLGCQFQCPDAGFLPVFAWAFVQHPFQTLCPVIAERPMQVVRAARTSLKYLHAMLIKSPDHISNRLIVAAQRLRDSWRVFAATTWALC